MSGTRHRIAALLPEGRSPAESAASLGLSRNTVYYHRDRLPHDAARSDPSQPAPLPRGVRRSVETRAEVERLLAEGLTRADVARRLGLAKATISYHARRLSPRRRPLRAPL